jgi:hypothetical protein
VQVGRHADCNKSIPSMLNGGTEDVLQHFYPLSVVYMHFVGQSSSGIVQLSDGVVIRLAYKTHGFS